MNKKIKFLRYTGFLLIILPALLGSFKIVSDGKPGIGLRVLPAQPLIELDAHGQYLNFDLAIANNSSHELAISALQVSVFDRSGKLVLRKFINSNGQAPSINLLGKTTVKANETIAIFNPLFSFAPGVPLYRLKYEVFFNFQDSEAQKTANARRLPLIMTQSAQLLYIPDLTPVRRLLCFP